MTFVCSAENGMRCDSLRGWWPHSCNFDEGHDSPHECLCGHVWVERDVDERADSLRESGHWVPGETA